MSVGLRAPGGDEYTADRTPPPSKSTLSPPGTPTPAHTATKLTDARTALTRGLAEYIEDLVVEQDDSRTIRLQKVFDTWAEAEETAEYPSAACYTVGPVVYEASSLTPSVDRDQRIPLPDGRYAVKMAEAVASITCEVWATDPVERMSLAGALEDAFNPHASRYGFVLELPHYHRARAAYEMMSNTYLDSEPDAVRRDRRVTFILSGRVPLIKLQTFPDARPQVRVEEVGPNVIVDVT